MLMNYQQRCLHWWTELVDDKSVVIDNECENECDNECDNECENEW